MVGSITHAFGSLSQERFTWTWHGSSLCGISFKRTYMPRKVERLVTCLRCIWIRDASEMNSIVFRWALPPEFDEVL